MTEAERRIRQFNLNFLPLLHSVLKHRNLTRAAEELNLTQSAVSNSLRRLREHFNDELLVKEGRNMRLTEKAKGLIEPLDQALAAVHAALADAPFAPATSTHHFRIATADYVAAITMPTVAAILMVEAPHMTVQMVTATARTRNDLLAGDVDLAIGPRQTVWAALNELPKGRENATIEPLFTEGFVCIGRPGDRRVEAGLDMAEYLARPHAVFSLSLNFHASIELATLAERDISQFNRLVISEFSLLPLIVSQSDCVAVVPESLARLGARSFPLSVGPCPLQLPDMELVMVFDKRRKPEPEHSWLRVLMKRSIEPLLSPPLARHAPVARRSGKTRTKPHSG